MLSRNSSSRRRRGSRSSTSSPQHQPQPRSRSANVSPGRRASIAVSPVDGGRGGMLLPDINRSPRHSIIPDISLESRDSSPDDVLPYGGRTPLRSLSPRGSIAPDTMLSPRNSMALEIGMNKSPRHSLVPDSSLNKSPRHSLVPGDYSRSPRNSLIPSDMGLSPRNSLIPDSSSFNRSPRGSLHPDPPLTRSARNSLIPDASMRSPRPSICEPLDEDDDYVPMKNRSPRHSIIPVSSEIGSNRSPRGSIIPLDATRTSPRGSIVNHTDYLSERSPRGSVSGESTGYNRSPRGSVARGIVGGYMNGVVDECREGRSPRGSLTLTFQEPTVSDVRRYSADNTASNSSRSGMPVAGGGSTSATGRSTSPYRTGGGRNSMAGNHSGGGAGGGGYSSTSALSDIGSRRASSSVSQVSGDEQKRLFTDHNNKYSDAEQGMGLSGISLTTYGSVAYQLKDANMEANDTCDFICKALCIVNRTIVVTIVLCCLTPLPVIMLIMGIQFIRDCPREPYIPVYMIVGGSMGSIKMLWLLYSQFNNRRLAGAMGNMHNESIGPRIASHLLTLFLITWFILGNYWILRIQWPDYSPTLFEPNRWCHRTLYVFAYTHLIILYVLIGGLVVLICALAGCQLYGCPFLGPATYK